MPENKPRILVVEDEPSLQETLAYNLARQGFDVEVSADGLQAIESAHSFGPDLILLDIMLPGLDGFEVCRRIRQKMSVPILMLTGRDSEIDRVVGLEIGADDYLIKPFSLRELQARVKALLRRVSLDHEGSDEGRGETRAVSSFGNLTLDPSRHEVKLDGRPLELKPKEYDLLTYLARHRGQALSRERIMESVWGWKFTGGSRTVDVHVRWLRAKIEPDPADPVRIVTLRGAGYRFEG